MGSEMCIRDRTGTIVIVSQTVSTVSTVSVSAILNFATWLKQTFPRCIAQLVTREDEEVREAIPHIGPFPIVIPFKLFLDFL